jgi:glucan phosphoethanolaminetransferase (alkaline phosphatase superfamily)
MIDEMTGLLTGLVGFALAAAGFLIALLASIRIAWVFRRPAKGRIARGLAVAGLVLLLCGALLVTVEEVDSPLRAASDSSAHYLAAAAVVLAAWAGYRSARRRTPGKAAAPAAPADPAARAPDAAQRS